MYSVMSVSVQSVSFNCRLKSIFDRRFLNAATTYYISKSLIKMKLPMLHYASIFEKCNETAVKVFMYILCL